jgi:hypothetical protein
MDTNTPRELVSGQDCESYGDLICDTPGSPGYIVINNTSASYYTNSVSRECIYHGYGGNYNPETGILQIGGYNKSYFQGYYPNYNFCEEWGFEDPYDLDENCELFTNYDNQGYFFGTRDVPAACINDDASEYAANCHIDQYSYLPIGNNFMQAGTATLHYCSPHPIGHANYDDTNHGFTDEQYENIRKSVELDYTQCNDVNACNPGLSIRKEIKEEYFLRSDTTSCLYPCNKQESAEYYEQFHPGCLITDAEYQSDYSQYDCYGNILSVNNNLTPQNFEINQIYPNPFNPITTIRYGLHQNTNIQVLIYNMQGRVITTLIDGFQTAGYHSVIWDASNFSSGIYFLNISSGKIAETKKMVLIK